VVSKPTLSREYIYVPLADLNFTVADLDLHRVAFTNAGVEPLDGDWNVATVIDSAHARYQASIGEAIEIMVGPDRGDAVTTFDLAAQDWQVWIEASTATSDERVVRVAGTLTVSATGA